MSAENAKLETLAASSPSKSNTFVLSFFGLSSSRADPLPVHGGGGEAALVVTMGLCSTEAVDIGEVLAPVLVPVLVLVLVLVSVPLPVPGVPCVALSAGTGEAPSPVFSRAWLVIDDGMVLLLVHGGGVEAALVVTMGVCSTEAVDSKEVSLPVLVLVSVLLPVLEIPWSARWRRRCTAVPPTL